MTAEASGGPRTTGGAIHALELALELKAAQDEGRQIEPLTARLSEFDSASAYEVAALIHAMRVAGGAKPVGRKLGFTNRSLWDPYQVDGPIWGFIYDETVVHLAATTATCSLAGLIEPRVEPELVCGMGQVPKPDATPEDLVRSIAWVAHAFEIVQCHFPGWKFRGPDTIADAALHGRLLIGPKMPIQALGEDPSSVLMSFEVSLAKDGQTVASGNATSVMGSPLNALRHLVERLESEPGHRQLQPGEIVATGTLTDAHAVRAGELWQSELQHIATPGLAVSFI